MRVLWFTGVQLPAVIGRTLKRAYWQEGLRAALEKYQPEIELAIASHGAEDYHPFQQGNARYYNILRISKPIAGRYRRILKNWESFRYDSSELKRYIEIAKDFKPDVVMFYGVENPYALVCNSLGIPCLVNIQGIPSAIADHMFDAISLSEFMRLLFSRNMLNGTGSIHRWRYLKSYGRIEREIFRLCTNYVGRTHWDRQMVERMHPGARYFHCDEILAESYYHSTWNSVPTDKVILYSTLNDALFKGATTLVRAVAELKKRGRKEVCLRIAGVSQESEVGKLVQRIIEENQLQDQVTLLGRISPEAIVQEMKSATVFIMPSHIENSSNSMAEAMLMGLPCISSNAGGLTSMIEDGINGLIYPHKSVALLVEKIEYLVNHPEKAASLGLAARESALKRHDPVKISFDMARIYKEVMAG